MDHNRPYNHADPLEDFSGRPAPLPNRAPARTLKARTANRTARARRIRESRRGTQS